ncbi:uncharacterized protein LOC120632913 [Pararge aegeria]|uniref:uncharacterized protein LOC120632913 n=1 Tax=Pararge aegeria TaxID=116150 RepID=UPI0019D314C0|nr:uncharacterized protein LOC120632913 [Pararge aegeria]
MAVPSCAMHVRDDNARNRRLRAHSRSLTLEKGRDALLKEEQYTRNISPPGGAPAFAPRQHALVLARAGDTAELRCRVLRLAERQVSWVRSSDLQILTHAGAVFTADARVSCSEAPDAGDADDADDWAPRVTSRDGGAAGAVHTLRIARLRPGDAGRYECQINTEPKMSLFFNLTVVESSLPAVAVRALGGARRGAAGGAAQLACEARYEPAPPALLAALPALHVSWARDGLALDPQSPRGGVSLDTERWAGRVRSRLTLARLRGADAGRYTCRAGAASAELRLRVGDGDAVLPYSIATPRLRASQSCAPARACIDADEIFQLREASRIILRRDRGRLRPRRGGAHTTRVAEGELEAMQRDEAAARVGAAVPLRATSLLLPLLLLPLLLT